jgi:hypothetical protein
MAWISCCPADAMFTPATYGALPRISQLLSVLVVCIVCSLVNSESDSARGGCSASCFDSGSCAIGTFWSCLDGMPGEGVSTRFYLLHCMLTRLLTMTGFDISGACTSASYFT